MRLLVILLITLFPIILKSQDVLTIDISTNTVKRSKIKTKNVPISDTARMQNYLNKVNSNFEIEDEKYEDVFNQMLRVGEYLVFEIVNFENEARADTIIVSYRFMDKNLEYASNFAGILNNGLKNLPGTSTTDNDTDEEEPSRIPASDDALIGSDDVIPDIFENEVKIAYIVDYYLTNIDSVETNLSARIDTFFNINIHDAYIQFQEESFGIGNAISFFADYMETNSINADEFLDSLNIAPIEIFSEYMNEETEDENMGDSTDENENQDLGVGATKRNFKFMPLQIQNSDLTYFYVNGLKDGRSVYVREYIFHNKYGFKSDFSVGFVASNLKDRTYLLKPQMVEEGMDPQNRIIEQDNGQFQIGIAIHGHFYTRIGRRFNLALSPGFAINTDSRINYLLGGSIILGKEQRFILNSGAAFGKVLRISDIYELGQLVDSNITEIPTKEIWKSGWYLGISYNF